MLSPTEENYKKFSMNVNNDNIMEVTLGGDRLGSGNKQKVEMHNYQMSSFNLEQDFKSSMAPGVLYPFIKLVGTNHGTFDIDLDSFVRTLPTRGPLFGSFKLQVDLFSVPMRLYQAILHNNPSKIGMKMNQVYLPKINIESFISHTEGGTTKKVPYPIGTNKYNYQINESCLLKYLGLSGIGVPQEESFPNIQRKINAIPVLAYYDIFKCYYANKQEEKAYVITPGDAQNVNTEIIKVAYGINSTTDGILWDVDTEMPVGEDQMIKFINIIYDKKSNLQDILDNAKIKIGTTYEKTLSEALDPNSPDIFLNYTHEVEWPEEWAGYMKTSFRVSTPLAETAETIGKIEIENAVIPTVTKADIQLTPFALQNIDDMRTAVLSHNNFGEEFVIGRGFDWENTEGTDGTGLPYSTLINLRPDFTTNNQFDLNGLVVKTYQSDLFNNWLDSEWIEGEEGIAALTAISTQDGKFTIDSFVFAEKLYDIYNRIATGGGTYEDWQEACYGEGAVRKAETPMYIGGMAAEVMFEEVISSAETNINGDRQALGSLGGKGTQVSSKGGHNIHVKCEEPSYIMGIVSLTPRICYSQGNDWDLVELNSMDDLHKPGLDGIGFQDLMVSQFAWWGDEVDSTGEITFRQSAGKQTAWINYQTAVDKCYGDFAKQDGYSFMVLNRNYEMIGDPREIEAASVKDITTYIDPSKFNYAFAYDELAAQNFWVQIHSKVVARRKMGAQQIPNL